MKFSSLCKTTETKNVCIEVYSVKCIECCPNQKIKANHKQPRVKANCNHTGVKAKCKQVLFCFVSAGFVWLFWVLRLVLSISPDIGPNSCQSLSHILAVRIKTNLQVHGIIFFRVLYKDSYQLAIK